MDVGDLMVNEWDDEGTFEAAADQALLEVDLSLRNPFDLSKALEGAALDSLRPDVKRFRLHAEFDPAGDQPKAIEKLISQLENGQERCVLLGVTGSGKTFAMAHVIQPVSYTHLRAHET